jgi:hypothetical protein
VHPFYTVFAPLNLNVAKKIPATCPPHPYLSPQNGGEGRVRGKFRMAGRIHHQWILGFIMKTIF